MRSRCCAWRSPPPQEQSEVIFVLTDDCIMAHTDRGLDHTAGFTRHEAARRVAQLDAAMRDNGVQQKPEKDVTADTGLTGMGCWLTGDPPRASPDADSIHRCVLAIWGLE